MQPWSHSNLISRCGTARVPHKHNCLLGTMISNEMRLHHHCNLSGKISTREWVPVPGSLVIWGAAQNLHLSLPISSTLSVSLKNLLTKYTIWTLWILCSLWKDFSWIFNAGQGICKSSNDYCLPSADSFQNGVIVFHPPCLFPSWFQNLFFFFIFLKWKSVLQVGDRSLLSWHAFWNSRDELYVDWKRSSLS